MKKIPSPMRETDIPDHSSAKSRMRSGSTILNRARAEGAGGGGGGGGGGPGAGAPGTDTGWETGMTGGGGSAAVVGSSGAVRGGSSIKAASARDRAVSKSTSPSTG